MIPRHGSFAGEIIQTLIDNVTTEEFKGKIIIILAGYEENVTELFGTNVGFQSRFDKMRVNFPPWTGQQAAEALINSIARDNKTITGEAAATLPALFESYSQLPNWSSARDVMDIVLPQLEAERASRSYEINKKRRELELAAGGGSPAAGKVRGPRGSAQRQTLSPPISYELSDVQKVFTNVIAARGGDIEGGPASIVRKIYNRGTFKELVKKSEKDKKILVVNFASMGSCPHSVTFAPIFEDIAGEFQDVVFGVVDGGNADDVFKSERVTGVPTTLLFYKGIRKAEVSGADGRAVRAEIAKIKLEIAKMKQNPVPPPPPPPLASAQYPSSGNGNRGPNITQLAREDRPRVLAQSPGGGGSEDEEKEEGSESDFWAALEEACAGK